MIRTARRSGKPAAETPIDGYGRPALSRACLDPIDTLSLADPGIPQSCWHRRGGGV